MCDVILGYACFVCVVMRLRLDKKLFILPFYVLITYFYVVMPICCVMSHPTLQRPVPCSFPWNDVITCKSKQITFWCFFLRFPNFLMFLNIQIDLFILKTYYGQSTLTTKKSLHIIFKAVTTCCDPFFYGEKQKNCRSIKLPKNRWVGLF